MSFEVVNIIKRNNIISLGIMISFLIFFLTLSFLELTLILSDYSWSLIFVLLSFFIVGLRIINQVSIASLYSLFFFTTILFLGGRFVSIFLGLEGEALFELDFFIYKIANDHEKSALFYLVMIGFFSLEVGLYFSKLFFKNKSNSYEKSEDLLIHVNKFLLYFIMFIIFSLLSSKIVNAFQLVLSGGYLALFQSQTEVYSFNVSDLLKTIMVASSGLFLSQSDKYVRNIFLILMGVYFTIDMILGGRGGFVCYLIFLVWYYHDYGLSKANIFKFLIYVFLILVFLSTIFGILSLRSPSEEHKSIFDGILNLIYSQGVTLMVFNESRFIEDYPVIPFFQNFIAGFSFIYSKIFGYVYPYEISFSSFISYKLNPQLYNMGYGLGWSFFSDAYLYGQRNALFYSFFIIAFSVFINFLQFRVTKNIILKVITISLVTSLLFLPRAGLNTIFPLIPYILVIFFFVKIASRVFKR